MTRLFDLSVENTIPNLLELQSFPNGLSMLMPSAWQGCGILAALLTCSPSCLVYMLMKYR